MSWLSSIGIDLCRPRSGGDGTITLVTMALSGTLTSGVSSSGTILGATPTSTIVSNVSGLTVNSGARTYSWDGTGAVATTSNGLVETLAGATGSPKSTSITVVAAVTLATLSLSGTITNGTSSSGTITGASTGSTIVSNVTGLTVNSGARTYSWDGTGTAGSTSNGLVETLSGAIGSPKNSSITVASSSGTATAPVLTKTSASAVNPMAWSGYYADMVPDSDYITMRWRVNSGSWNNDTNHLFTTDDFLDSEDGAASFLWPLFQAASPFAAGALVEVQEGVLRGSDPIVWSSIISDTMATVPWVYNAAPAVYTTPFGAADPVTFAAETFAAGTGIVCLAAGNNPPSGVTIAGAAMTLVSSKTNGNDGLYIYAKSGLTAGTKDIVVTPSTMNLRTYGIATGTLASSINATPTATATQNYGFNGDPQTSGTFTLPANGVAIALVGIFGSGVVTTWDSGYGTANTERHGAAYEFQFATGSMIGGGSSASGKQFQANGYNFVGSMMTVVVFGP